MTRTAPLTRATILALLLTLAAGAAMTAPASAAACTDGIELRTTKQGSTVRTAAVLCAPGASRRTVARATWRKHGAARRITGVARSGRWVGLGFQERRRSLAGEVRLLDLQSGRTLYRFTGVTRHGGPVRVALGDRGELAWSMDRRLRVRSISADVRTVFRGRIDTLAVEDGRTVRWRSADEFGYHDLRPWPAGECPQRSKFTDVRDVGDVIVSEAVYANRSFSVVRACLKSTGRDRVVVQTRNYAEDATGFIPFGSAGPLLALGRSDSSQYGCNPLELSVLDVRSGRVLRKGTDGTSGYGDCGPTPAAGEPVVVGATGAVAWVHANVLYGLGADEKVAILDRGAITALRVTADGVAWTRDGVERSAAL